MKVYRFSPLATDDPSWKFSVENNHVWPGALSLADARELVADKTGFAKLAEPSAVSPWKDERVASCTEEPTMNCPGPGEVIRENGSRVAD